MRIIKLSMTSGVFAITIFIPLIIVFVLAFIVCAIKLNIMRD